MKTHPKLRKLTDKQLSKLWTGIANLKTAMEAVQESLNSIDEKTLDGIDMLPKRLRRAIYKAQSAADSQTYETVQLCEDAETDVENEVNRRHLLKTEGRSKESAKTRSRRINGIPSRHLSGVK